MICLQLRLNHARFCYFSPKKYFNDSIWEAFLIMNNHKLFSINLIKIALWRNLTTHSQKKTKRRKMEEFLRVNARPFCVNTSWQHDTSKCLCHRSPAIIRHINVIAGKTWMNSLFKILLNELDAIHFKIDIILFVCTKSFDSNIEAVLIRSRAR